MIDSAKVLYSPGENDECLTPAYGVKPILKYIPEGVRIWCPFDTHESEFVKQISKNRECKIVYSHISCGRDFYSWEPKDWDILISNPPLHQQAQDIREGLEL